MTENDKFSGRTVKGIPSAHTFSLKACSFEFGGNAKNRNGAGRFANPFEMEALLGPAVTGYGIHSSMSSGLNRYGSAGLAESAERNTWKHEVSYQPQCLASGELVAFEAFVQARYQKSGCVSSSVSTESFEKDQFGHTTSAWTVREVCRQIRKWQTAGYLLVPVAINISSAQLSDECFHAELALILDETGVSPSLLKLEFKEDALRNDCARYCWQLRELKRLGVRLSAEHCGIDPFSLNYLHRLPADELKIDRSSVAVITEQSGMQQIVNTLISVAHTLAMQVVGEGVETVAQMQILNGNGCDCFQGPLYSPPVSQKKAASYLGTRNIALYATV